MTTQRKIEILNQQIDKFRLDTFYFTNWKTETLEYIRVFFGEDSEAYKTCKKYNDEVDEELKTKNYNGAMWMLRYTEMLFSDVGILQHELYKRSKLQVTFRGITLFSVVALISGAMLISYYVGKYEGIALGESLVAPQDSIRNLPQKIPQDSAANKSMQNHKQESPIDDTEK